MLCFGQVFIIIYVTQVCALPVQPDHVRSTNYTYAYAWYKHTHTHTHTHNHNHNNNHKHNHNPNNNQELCWRQSIRCRLYLYNTRSMLFYMWNRIMSRAANIGMCENMPGVLVRSSPENLCNRIILHYRFIHAMSRARITACICKYVPIAFPIWSGVAVDNVQTQQNREDNEQ